jgi:hypothetical protein
MSGLYGGRKLSTTHFNNFLVQECAAIERFYNTDKIRKDVVPATLRAIFLTDVIGDDPFTQATIITGPDEQQQLIIDAAETAFKEHPDKKLAAAFYMTALMVDNKETGEVKKMLVLSGRTADGRTNGAIYFYEVDEDGRYYVTQDIIRPYDAESITNMEIRMPPLDEYFKIWTQITLQSSNKVQ